MPDKKYGGIKITDNPDLKFPEIPDRISGLKELAFNLWWSWHPRARMLFKTLDRPKWKESHHNPVQMLRELPAVTLERFSKDPEYLRRYDAVMAEFTSSLAETTTWFSQQEIDPGHQAVAYFSAEYGLHHSLPFYAGGLGFLAGDYLKECSDLGVPVVGVGFMYPEGYTRQRIRDDGWQQDVDDGLDRDIAPITRVMDTNGSHLTVEVPFIKPRIRVAVWKVQVGRVPLYLMDTDIGENDPWNRAITSHLYGGDNEHRLQQEIVLGIGGSVVLNTLGIRHSAAHMNEGHAAFALLERVRERVEGGVTYADAATAVAATSVFTTHTPVPAGHDVFPFSLMEKYFGNYYPLLGMDRDTFLRLGIHPAYPNAGFNMTAFALRMSRYHNAVSKRHGEVARHMWRDLWPGTADDNVPIDSVTNGIHVPTWIEPKMELLLDTYLGRDWLTRHDDPATFNRIDDIPDMQLWQTHVWLKMKLLNTIRTRARQLWAGGNVSASNVLAEGLQLDPTVLTIGFARRFATYKRADLIFSDMDRLRKLLEDQWKPVQIIFAGKAHPADDEGKRILQRVFTFARDVRTVGRVAFVENYDEQMAQYMVHGVDVWLNNPLPPLEACGTSGMKASLNGVPQLSVRDGWWIEGFNGKNGWSFGDGDESGRDRTDAQELYNLLENEIIPRYYRLDDDGIPREWVRTMKDAMKSTAAAFSSRRMAKEYVNRFYRGAL
jgi:starch phosphorylase